MNTTKWFSVLFGLLLTLSVGACGDDSDDDPSGDNNSNSSAGSTVDQSEFVDACIEYHTTCSPEEGFNPQQDCPELWEMDQSDAANPDSCAAARAEGWDCLIAEDCDGGPQCADAFQAIGEHCQY